MFESVSHLINYHSEKNMPIISAESAIVLRHPVYRQGPLKTLWAQHRRAQNGNNNYTLKIKTKQQIINFQSI